MSFIPKKNASANLENKRAVWLVLGIAVTAAILLSAFNWTTFDIEERATLDLSGTMMEEEQVPINSTPPPPPPPPPPAPTTAIEIVEDEEEVEEQDMTFDEADEDFEVDDVEDFDDGPLDDTPFMVVEDMPYLPACASIFNKTERDQCVSGEIIKYISSNTKYPDIAKEAGISGIVFVSFVVGRKGEVEDVEILRKVHPSLDKEAMRVVKSLPKFTPGKQLGKAVRVKYSIPVRFTLRS